MNNFTLQLLCQQTSTVMCVLVVDLMNPITILLNIPNLTPVGVMDMTDAL